jgi:hypothetical protein
MSCNIKTARFLTGQELVNLCKTEVRYLSWIITAHAKLPIYLMQQLTVLQVAPDKNARRRAHD